MIINENKENKTLSYEEYPYATYVRISTDKEEQESSPENQIDICRYWLEKNGFEWSDKSVQFDDGITGTVLLDRTAMQLILDKARRREIKMVIFKSISRLARDLRDSLEIKETLIAHGVRLVTIEEGYDSLHEGKNDMKFEMFSMFAAQLPKTASVSISASMTAKVRRGEHVGQVPFGYSLKNKKLEINESEAPTIRQIFSWYNEDGFGFKTITRLLNEENEAGNLSKPRKKDKWQMTTVQRIIQNPTYAGMFIHNRYTKVKIGGRKKQIQNPREKWSIYEDHHPAIISKADWEKANSKEVMNKKTKITPWNEFRGLLRCSECGSNMVILQTGSKKKDGKKDDRWKYLKCSAYRRGGSKHGCVNHSPILYDDFREFLLKKLLRKGKNTKIKFENNLHEKKKKEIAVLQKQKLHLEEKNKSLVDIYLDKLIGKDEFQLKRQEYTDEIKKIEDKIFILSQEKDMKVEIESIQEAFEQLKNHKQDLHHALSTLIDHVVVHPDGKLDIHYKFKL
ncbi:recombinase family protein [Caldibacillus lycopersici]|uniref:Recombinase family protein n=1 Tax=Perspicuibacillus lycopersici TaxID=1325689 RepID=A0AAE3ITV2_9BACI|nr:recombinase family protein [Perspicuibacillus lycopersici]MCU9614057.1 recombinase family protein [Perspicuibacillus lycopersici]